MSAESNGNLIWDLDEIARALKINKDAVREYFTDGRRVSFILERRLSNEVFNGSLAPSEGAGYDLMDTTGGKWEVRSITKRGIYFCPSYMVGSGRHFELDGFISKLNEVKGYVISDVEGFPNVPFWIIPSEQVRKWWDGGQLKGDSSVSREKIIHLLRIL